MPICKLLVYLDIMLKEKLVLLALGCSFVLTAQKSLDILTISGTFSSPKSYVSTYDSKAKETGAMIDLVLPIKMNEQTFWYNGLNYMNWNINNSEGELPGLANPIKLHGFILRTGLYKKFSNGTGIQILFSPRLMTDFKHVDAAHFQLGGIVLYEKKYNENLKMSYGAMYNKEFSGPYLVPLVAVNWQMSEKWTLSGLLPIYSKVSYAVNESLAVGMHHFGLVTSYKLGDEAYKGDYIERKSIDLGAFARCKIQDNISLEARCGYSFARSYAQFTAEDTFDLGLPLATFNDYRIQKNTTFKDGAYLNMRLVYSVPLN